MGYCRCIRARGTAESLAKGYSETGRLNLCPEVARMTTWPDGHASGRVSWRFLSAAVVAWAGLRFLILYLWDRGLLDRSSALIVDGAATVVILVVLAWLSIRLADRMPAGDGSPDAASVLSETGFEAMFTDAPIGYHELDGHGRITRVNRTELAALGYASEDMVGREVWEFVEDSDASRRAVREKLAGTSHPTGSYERAYRRKDGTSIPVLVQDRILRTRDGRITGIRTTFQDITEIKRSEAEREQLIATLQETLAEVKTLKGLIPICASCKKVRDDQGFWNQVENYIMRFSEASFSHSICPECVERLYPELHERQDTE
jgi:PAS domain S-box-containing protein